MVTSISLPRETLYTESQKRRIDNLDEKYCVHDSVREIQRGG